MNDVLKQIKWYIHHMINRCGQVVPYELKEILKLIEEYEG